MGSIVPGVVAAAELLCHSGDDVPKRYMSANRLFCRKRLARRSCSSISTAGTWLGPSYSATPVISTRTWLMCSMKPSMSPWARRDSARIRCISRFEAWVMGATCPEPRKSSAMVVRRGSSSPVTGSVKMNSSMESSALRVTIDSPSWSSPRSFTWKAMFEVTVALLNSRSYIQSPKPCMPTTAAASSAPALTSGSEGVEPWVFCQTARACLARARMAVAWSSIVLSPSAWALVMA